MLGVVIGETMFLVDSIDREGLILKVSSKSLDFWLRSHGRNVEGLSVGEVVRQNWLERLRKSACKSIGWFFSLSSSDLRGWDKNGYFRLGSFSGLIWSDLLVRFYVFLVHLLLSRSGRAGMTKWFLFDCVRRGAVFGGPPLWSETKLWSKGSHFWSF